MLKQRRWATALFLGWLAASGAQAADWIRAQSEHFNVSSDAGERGAREYLRQLEVMHQVVLMLVGGDAAKAKNQPRLDLFLLRDGDDMRRVRSHFVGISGVHTLCSEGSVAYAHAPPSTLGLAENPGLKTLFHEYGHHMMYQYASTYYPAWYAEGFAEFLGNSVLDGDKMRLGEVARNNALWLRTQPWIDMELVLKPPFKSTGDKDAIDRNADGFYKQSWLLAHYMLSDSERTKKFNDYFARLGAGEDAITTFEPATGIALDKLASLLKRHLTMLPVMAISTKSMALGEVKVDSLPADAEHYLLDASVLRTCPPKADGQAILARLQARAAKGSPSVALKLALARAHLLFGDRPAATTLLQELVSADEGSFEAQYLLGRALAQGAEDLAGEAQQALRAEARSHLFKAYRLKKNDAPTLYHVARLLALDGPGPSLLNAAQGARALAPGVSEYAHFEAMIDLDAGDHARALRALAPLASDPHNPLYAARVREAMDAIRAGKDRSTVQSLLAPPSASN